jgi:hypothetical protein
MLHSNEWYAGNDRNPHIHRAWMRRILLLVGRDLDQE